MTRFIRLKEYAKNQKQNFTLSEESLRSVDGTLPSDTIRVRTDENGFIDNGNNHRGDRLIVCVGDSVIECYNIQDTDRVCSVLERLVIQDDARLKVCNSGYSGSTTLHTFNAVLNKIIPLRPEIIVLSNGPIDALCCRRINGFWSTNTYLNPLVGVAGPLPEFPDSKTDLQLNDRNIILGNLIYIIKRFGIKVFVTTVPHKPLNDPFVQANLNKKGWMRDFETFGPMNQSIRNVCSEYGAVCIDLAQELQGRPELFYDLCTSTKKGLIKQQNVFISKSDTIIRWRTINGGGSR